MDDWSRSVMDAVRLPIWARIAVIVVLVILVSGASLFGYRWYERPVTLSIAVGSLDGEAPKSYPRSRAGLPSTMRRCG